MIRLGVSPRGALAVLKMSKAHAYLEGRDYVTTDDVQQLVQPVWAHRLLLSGEARFSGKTAESILQEVVAAVEVPPSTEELFRGR